MATPPWAPTPNSTGTLYRATAASPEEEKPFGPAVLVIVGSLFVLLEGLLFVAFGRFLELASIGFLGSSFVIQGVVISLLGLILFALGLLIHGEPHHHVANGLAVILLVILSLIFGFGGFLIGAFLAFIGGAWSISWVPSALKGPSSVRRQTSN